MNEGAVLYRYGYTTGACAQAAAKAAAYMLVHGRTIDSIDVELPIGEVHSFALINQAYGRDFARCSVIKDSGDDTQDVTHGMEIHAEIIRLWSGEERIVGGQGVGIATESGLAVEPGEPAINPVPKKMILRDVKELLKHEDGFCVEISVPHGDSVAYKTYNPRLGIKGGISILGTMGVVIRRSE